MIISRFLIPTLTLLLSLSFSLPAYEAQADWVMQEQSVKWPEGIEEKTILKLFQENNIVILTLPAEKWDSISRSSSIERSFFEKQDTSSSALQEIWHDDLVKVSVSDEGIFRLFPLRPVKSLCELETKEKIALENTALKLSTVFKETLGCQDYLKWIPLGEKAEQVGEFFYVEILPTPTNKEESVDVLQKMQHTAYITMKGIPLPPLLSHEQIKKIKKIAGVILNQDCFPTKPTFSETTRRGYYENLFPCRQYLAELILKRVFKRGDPLLPIISSNHKPPIDNPRVPKAAANPTATSCPFCSLHILEKQKVYESSHNWVLTNYRPYAKAHLMTVTKEHFGNGVKLSDEQILDKYRLWARIDSIYRNYLGCTATVVITRCGIGAGQTSAHNHDHLVGIDPNEVPYWLFNAFFELCQNPTKIAQLTGEDMTVTRNLLGPRFARIHDVIFDFGGVVIKKSNPEKDLDFIASKFGTSREKIYQHFAQFVTDLNNGKVSEKDFWEKLAQDSHVSVPKNWDNQWKKQYVSNRIPDQKVLDLVQHLREKGYLTPLLSNTITSHAVCNKESGLFDPFFPVFLSHERGFRKPDPKAYLDLLRTTGTRPEECVFVDDLLENVRGAQAVGMHGIHFQSAEQLEQELRLLLSEQGPGF